MSANAPGWLEPLSGVVQRRLGLAFPPERWPDLERSIRLASQEAGAPDADTFVQRLLLDPDAPQLEWLAHALTIGETYFFREPASFEVIEREFLPRLIEERRPAERRLRLWSAGCCTGEEVYSLAIIVDRLLPCREDWQITILGTDVNPRFLRAAARGEFGCWSFRNAPDDLRKRYFQPVGQQRFVIDSRIHRMVTFAWINLAEASYPSSSNGTEAVDLILCRNVLMYLSPDMARQALGRFERALRPGGSLLLSATETSVGRLGGLVPIPVDGAVFYRKPAPADPMPEVSGAGLRRLAEVVSASPRRRVSAPPPPKAAMAAPAAQPEAIPAVPDEEGLQENSALTLAYSHADAGRLDAALEAITRALQSAKLDASAHHLHAAILIELGREVEAREALRRTLYLDPDFVPAHYRLGQLELRQGRGPAARRHFANALALLARHDPESLPAHSGGLSAGLLRTLIEQALAAKEPT